MKKYLLLLLLGYSTLVSALSLVDLDPKQLQARQRDDLEAVLRWREGLRQTLDYAASQPQLFQADSKTLRPHEQREALRIVWQQISDYCLALDAVAGLHADFYRLSASAARSASFQVSQAAFLAQYRIALEFLEASHSDTSIDILLNEPMPDLGLPAGSFDRFKFRFLNVAMATEFTARELLRSHYKANDARLKRTLDADAAVILAKGKGKGETMTFLNALHVVSKTSFDAWLPVQAGVAGWMGDTKVYRAQQNLITPAQIATLPARLEPGDILLERREWYISNAGLPGYWPHAALYVATPEERESYFDTPEVSSWVKSQGETSGQLEALLRRKAPKAEADSRKPRPDGMPTRVLEAVSEGVTFTSLEHTANADSFAVLRPRLSRLEKAKALLRAYGYHGRPYDFNFDFRSDASLVCSELVYKAYESGREMTGLHLSVSQILGRLATTPNDIAKLFDEESGSPAQQMDFVVFLDGHEGQQRAQFAGLEAFRSSWRRPKWHLIKSLLPVPASNEKRAIAAQQSAGDTANPAFKASTSSRTLGSE